MSSNVVSIEIKRRIYIVYFKLTNDVLWHAIFRYVIKIMQFWKIVIKVVVK